MPFFKKALIAAAGVALLATPVFAQGSTTGSQSPTNQDATGAGSATPPGAIGPTKPNSGPGVQGPADTRTGPSTHVPGGSTDAGASSSGSSAVAPGNTGSATTGASSGDAGAAGGANLKNETSPSQDSSGVQGFPDTRTGPSTKSPDANSGTSGGSGAGQGSSKSP